MKEYKIKMMDACPADWSGVACAMLDEFVWMKDYTPKAYAQVVFVKGDGFYARLTCEESDPKAVHTTFFSDVYKDSCLEFFAAYDASKPDYINIEMNSLGASLIAIGPDRNARTRIDEIVGHPFDIKAEKEADKWHVTAHVTLADLSAIYQLDPAVFVPGYSFRGNFYKCGDETAVEHYGMWSPVGTEKPDYHRPEYFGKLTITE